MPTPRKRRDTDTDNDDDTPRSYAMVCFSCTSPDPQERTRHHFKIMKERNIAVLKDHLVEQFVTLREAGKKRQDSVDSIVNWARNLIDHYSGLAHPDDGHEMPWWEARQWMMDHRKETALSAYNQAPEAYKQPNPPLGHLKPVVQTVTAHLKTEPGDDDPMGI